MKCGLIAISGLMAIIGSGLMAAEIDSGVIHNYSFLSLGYGYAHDIADSGVDGHGAVGLASIEENNFVLGAGGGYFWASDDEPDVEFWTVNATFGYVLRFAQNH